jgi:hypothetical protein
MAKVFVGELSGCSHTNTVEKPLGLGPRLDIAVAAPSTVSVGQLAAVAGITARTEAPLPASSCTQAYTGALAAGPGPGPGCDDQ